MAKSKAKKFNVKQILDFRILFPLLLIAATAGNVYFTVTYVEDAIYSSVGTRYFTEEIIQATTALNKPMNADITEDKQYLPEMKLSFPYSTSTELQYRYEPANEISPPYALVTSTQLQDRGIELLRNQFNPESVLESLPEAQKCSRTFMLFDEKDLAHFEKEENTLSPAGSFSTADGRTIVAYYEQTPCTDDSQQLIEEATATILGGQSY